MKKTFVYLGALTTLDSLCEQSDFWWTLDYLNHNSSSNSGWAEDSRQSTSYLCEQAPIKTLDTKAMVSFSGWQHLMKIVTHHCLEELFSTVHYYSGRRQLTALHLELPWTLPHVLLLADFNP